MCLIFNFSRYSSWSGSHCTSVNRLSGNNVNELLLLCTSSTKFFPTWASLPSTFPSSSAVQFTVKGCRLLAFAGSTIKKDVLKKTCWVPMVNDCAVLDVNLPTVFVKLGKPGLNTVTIFPSKGLSLWTRVIGFGAGHPDILLLKKILLSMSYTHNG
jgi:hypothetical protein